MFGAVKKKKEFDWLGVTMIITIVTMIAAMFLAASVAAIVSAISLSNF